MAQAGQESALPVADASGPEPAPPWPLPPTAPTFRGGNRSQSSIPIRLANRWRTTTRWRVHSPPAEALRPRGRGLHRPGRADPLPQNGKRSVAPDVFGARGGPKRSRDTDKIWEERKPVD